MQYLVRCSDKSYCLLRQNEIVFDSEKPDLEVGDEVSFFWNGKLDKVFNGTIIQASGKRYFFRSKIDSIILANGTLVVFQKTKTNSLLQWIVELKKTARIREISGQRR